MAILSRVFGRRAEQRFTAKTSDLVHWKEIYPWLETTAGERVTPQSALGLAAYFACVRNIAEDTAKLPLHVFRKQGQNRIPVDHEVDYLLNVAPNDDMSAMDFRQTLTLHAAGMGNGYGRIVFGGGSRIEALTVMESSRVKPKREKGQLFYEYWTGGKPEILMPREVLHIRGLSNEGIVGYPIVTLAREVLAGALATQKFSAAFFGNGCWPGGTLEHPDKLGAEAHKNLMESIEKRHRGAGAAHKLMILEEGMEYKAHATAPENAQLVEMLYFLLEEVCRYYRMPPHKIQHLLRATFSNIEHQGLEYVGDTLMPWHLRWEQECKRKLFSQTVERSLYIRHNVAALLRADAVRRATYYGKMLGSGVYSINEVRALEEMNSIPAGDDHHIPLNMKVLGEEPEPKPVVPPEPAPTVSTPDEDTEEARGRVLPLVEAQRAALTDAYARVLRVETDKAQRARKRDGLDEWAAEFYPGHGAHVAEVLHPTLCGLHDTARSLGLHARDPEAIAAELAMRHVNRSLADIRGGDLENWTDGRPAAAATEAIQYLCDQMGAIHATTQA